MSAFEVEIATDLNHKALDELLVEALGAKYQTLSGHPINGWHALPDALNPPPVPEPGMRITIVLSDAATGHDVELARAIALAHDPARRSVSQALADHSHAARLELLQELESEIQQFEQPLRDDLHAEIATLRTSYARLLRAVYVTLERG
jgi:hypothetical protein